jgi:hypothetical protein
MVGVVGAPGHRPGVHRPRQTPTERPPRADASHLDSQPPRPPAAKLRAPQRKFNRCRAEFNQQRPHEALALQTPAALDEPSPRPMLSKLPPLSISPTGHFVLICQGASQLHSIGTLLQPNDQPVLQGPHVRETSGEPLAAPSSTPRIAAEGDDAFSCLEKLGAVRDEFVKVGEEATKKSRSTLSRPT